MHIHSLLLSSCLAASPYPVTIFSQTDGVCRQGRNVNYSAVSLIINTQKPLKMLAHRGTRDYSNREVLRSSQAEANTPGLTQSQERMTTWILQLSCSMSCVYMPWQLSSSLWTSWLGVSSVFPQSVASRDLLSLNNGTSHCREELWSTCLDFPGSSLLAAMGDPGTGVEGLRQIKSWLCHGSGKGKCNVKTREGRLGDFSLVCWELWDSKLTLLLSQMAMAFGIWG